MKTPVVDPQLIAALRRDLESAGWTVEAVEASLSPAALGALEADQLVPASVELQDATDASALLTRLFILAESLTQSQVCAALPTLKAEGAQELGLLAPDTSDTEADSYRADRSWRATVDLRPHSAQFPVTSEDSQSETDLHRERSWWVASDLGQAQTGLPPADDHVLGIAQASKTLLQQTPRNHVASALDLGCGCGILALHLAEHADRVFATDISERACQFTRFNAALNQAPIQVLQGSLFEPVADQMFSLIVSNPPFVITPQSLRERRKLTYRDGLQERDSLIRLVLSQAGNHLADKGVLVMLANWEVGADPANWDKNPREWIEQAATAQLAQGRSVRAVVIQRDLVDSVQYAQWWIRDAHGDQVERAVWDGEFREWIGDFSSAGTHFVGLGTIALQVREQVDPGLDLVAEDLSDANPLDGPAVVRRLANVALPPNWEDVAFTKSEDVREVRYYQPGHADPELIRISQGLGGGRERTVSSSVAAFIGVCDGELVPAQIIPAIAVLSEKEPQAVQEEIADALPELLRSGVLRRS